VTSDETFMLAALEQARLGEQAGDVPVGAVIVRDGEIIAAAFNRRIIDKDPTRHAEMIAIQAAAAAVGDWRLGDCTIYVTLEPCCMCAGAIVLARFARLVYGADDPKAGGVRTLYRLCEDQRLNHRLEVTPGVLADQCGQVLTEFFRRKRRQ
jgi:tRNA(Arg) A34 adenosine deaminase TadA